MSHPLKRDARRIQRALETCNKNRPYLWCVQQAEQHIAAARTLARLKQQSIGASLVEIVLSAA